MVATSSRVALVQATFDYESHAIVAAGDVKALEKHAKTICETQDQVRKTTAEGVLRIGKELAAARDRLANHGNGTFGKWCKERCGISHVTAYKAIAVVQQFGDCKLDLQSFDATSLYLLSAESCPEEACDEAMRRAEQGESITAKVAKQIIKSHSPVADDDASDGEEDDADDSLGDWQPADCIVSLRKEVKRWLAVCPPDDLHFIHETLRDLAAQLESRNDE